MLDVGGYSWNSGIFLFKASVFLAELERFAPVIFQEAENRVHAQKAVLATLAEASKA